MSLTTCQLAWSVRWAPQRNVLAVGRALMFASWTLTHQWLIINIITNTLSGQCTVRPWLLAILTACWDSIMTSARSLWVWTVIIPVMDRHTSQISWSWHVAWCPPWSRGHPGVRDCWQTHLVYSGVSPRPKDSKVVTQQALVKYQAFFLFVFCDLLLLILMKDVSWEDIQRPLPECIYVCIHTAFV